MSRPTRTDLRSLILTLIIGLLAATLCAWLDWPLPWMIGPLFATAAARMTGAELSAPIHIRRAGQWAIGTALGLYFTPVVLAVLVSYIGFILAGVVFAALLGALCGWLLHRMSGTDTTTAFFAMAVGGASEMATQGERHGAAVDRVAAAHSLRIMMVVAIIPFCFKFSGIHGIDAYMPGSRVVAYGGLSLLIVLTSLCALLLSRLDVPNAWVIGPLALTTALTGFELHLSALPEWMVHVGQLFIGISLGTRFTPEFLHTAPRYLMSVATVSGLAILIAAAFGVGLAHISGMSPATAILATAPGGIAEMSLTAKNLRLGVPIVTAFHVGRMALLVLMIGPIFRLIRKIKPRREQA